MTRRRIVLMATLVLLTITACGATDNASDTASEQTASASSTPAEPESSEPTEDTTPPAPHATCRLRGKRRAKVTLKDSGDALVASFDGQRVVERGTTLYAVTAFDDAGEIGVQLGMKFQDGKQIGYFVFDFGTSKQTNLEGSPERSGKTVRGTFPADALGDLADAGAASWSAAINVNGNDVGNCPGSIDSLPFPG